MKNTKPLVVSSSDKPFSPNWRNILFMIPVHMIGFVAYPLWLYFSGASFSGWDLGIFAGMYALGAFGICVGYHRGFSHRTFTMSFPVKILALIAGASAGEGSALSWCSDHRRHHAFEDTPRDPYNVNRSFWWAHFGWLIGSPTSTDFTNAQDLQRDPYIHRQHQFYAAYLILFSFGLPCFLGWLVGRPIEGLLFGGFARLTLLNHATFLINSYAHYFGRRPYSMTTTARDSLLLAFLAWGEGWHNFHHKFPYDYRNGSRFFHWDPSKWLIFLMSRLNLVSSLKITPDPEILKVRMEVLKAKRPEVSAHPRLKQIEESLLATYQRWRKAYLEWQEARKIHDQQRAARLAHLKSRMKEAQREFRMGFALWKASLRNSGLTA